MAVAEISISRQNPAYRPTGHLMKKTQNIRFSFCSKSSIDIVFTIGNNEQLGCVCFTERTGEPA